MRNRWTVLVVTVVTVVIAADCGGGGGQSGSTVASRLVMGGPPECRTRVTCLPGLESIYGLHFKSFKTLDEVGPISESALAHDQVQVVRLDSSDYAIQDHKWVILDDDKHFQQAGNIVPVIRTVKATPEVTALLNSVSAALTQADLFTLDKEVGAQHEDPADAAKTFVQAKGFSSGSGSSSGKESITIGSVAFSENAVLADVYGEVLKNAGYSIHYQANLASREITEPALESGQIDLLPEYVGNYLTYVQPSAGSLPADAAAAQLRTLVGPKGLTVLDPSSATDADAIVVTTATAKKYHLIRISDLAQKA